MSSCLIIAQDDNIFIGSDTACSLKINNRYYRISNNMKKLFCVDNKIFFCSGRKSCVDDFMKQVYKNDDLDINVLSKYLKNKYPYTENNDSFDLEVAIVDYGNYTVTQLSQYNNFQKIIYPRTKDVQIIACGYNTSKTFELAKRGILSNIPIYDLFLNVFKEISNEYIGGYLDFYSSVNSHYIKEISIIKPLNNVYSDSDLLLLTSNFVTSGVVSGTQFIAGKIYSSPDTLKSNRFSYLNLDDGTFSFAGGKIKYDGSTLSLSGVSLKWSDVKDAPTKLSAFTNDTGYQTESSIKNTIITKDYIETLNIMAGSVAAENITGTTLSGKTIKGGAIYSSNYASGVGTYLNLNDGTFSFGSGKITYDGTTLALNGVNILWKDINDATTNVSAIAKDTIDASHIKTLNLEVGNQISMGANAKISWSNVTNQPTIPTNTNQLTNGAGYTTMSAVEEKGYQNASQVTTITNNTIATTNVIAQNLQVNAANIAGTLKASQIESGTIIAGSVAAENITGTTISGKTIYGGKVTGAVIEGSVFNVNTDVSYMGNAYINISAGKSGDGKFYHAYLTPNYLWVSSEAHGSSIRIESCCLQGSASSTSMAKVTFSIDATKGNASFSGTVYTASGTVSKSDRDAKNSIELLDLNASSEFIYSLKPSRFKFNNGTSNRFHRGLIAQEVKESMGDEDWGLYVDENPEELGNKGLRYEELIADLVATVQTLNERIKILENKE